MIAIGRLVDAPTTTGGPSLPLSRQFAFLSRVWQNGAVEVRWLAFEGRQPGQSIDFVHFMETPVTRFSIVIIVASLLTVAFEADQAAGQEKTQSGRQLITPAGEQKQPPDRPANDGPERGDAIQKRLTEKVERVYMARRNGRLEGVTRP